MNGYKCFNKDSTNSLGIKMEVGKIYTTPMSPTARNSGYHFCKNLEDTLRYFNGLEEEITICQVKAIGNISEYTDEWYDYDIYATDKLYIEKILSRKEIITYADKLDNNRLIRFIQGFKLTQEEISYFKEKYNQRSIILNYLKYYQEGDLEVFEKEYKNFKKR